MSWNFYADSGCTVLMSPVDLFQATNVGPADRIVYFANPNAGFILQKGSAPGVDPLELQILDSAPGSGLAASVFTLALSLGDLDTNTPGDPLELGVTLLSGAANALAVFVRLDAGMAAAGVYTELTFRVADQLETAA